MKVMAVQKTSQYRKHIRLDGLDYRENHAYFVTIVTGQRQNVFGEIQDGVLKPTRRGLVAMHCWDELPSHHPFIELDAFILMPNHVHGILMFVGGDVSPVAATPASPIPCGPRSQSLGAVVGSYKSSVSRTINRLRPGAASGLWQQNYYEHVIRCDKSLDRIRQYIDTNPLRWGDDVENPLGSAKDDPAAFFRSLGNAKMGDAGVAATGGTDVS